jgi:hypothetical protein
MAASEQMNRKELLEARRQIKEQLDIISSPMWARNSIQEARLAAMLAELDESLAELGPDHA